MRGLSCLMGSPGSGAGGAGGFEGSHRPLRRLGQAPASTGSASAADCAVGLGGAVHGGGGVAQGHAERGDLHDVLDPGTALAVGPLLVVRGAVHEHPVALAGGVGQVLGQLPPAGGLVEHRRRCPRTRRPCSCGAMETARRTVHTAWPVRLREPQLDVGGQVAFGGDRGGHASFPSWGWWRHAPAHRGCGVVGPGSGGLALFSAPARRAPATGAAGCPGSRAARRAVAPTEAAAGAPLTWGSRRR